MQYIITINQKKAMEYGLNIKQAALMDHLGKLSTWANAMQFDDGVYYSVALNKICTDLPMVSDKTDTISRHLKVLKDKGLLDQHKHGSKKLNYLKLSALGKTFFGVGKKSETEGVTEKNPKCYGKKSETLKQGESVVDKGNVGSVTEKNPNILYTNNINDTMYIQKTAFNFLLKHHSADMEAWMMQNKKYISDWDHFVETYNNKCDIEQLEFNYRVLMGRLRQLKANWSRSLKNSNQTNGAIPSSISHLKKIG